MTIDPDIGGATHVEGGRPLAILTAGYVGSTIFGGVFVLAGFDILMSKILSFVLGLGLIAPLALVRNKLCVVLPELCVCYALRMLCLRTILLTCIYEGLLVGFWFVDHGYVNPFLAMMMSRSYRCHYDSASTANHYDGIASSSGS